MMIHEDQNEYCFDMDYSILLYCVPSARIKHGIEKSKTGSEHSK